MIIPGLLQYMYGYRYNPNIAPEFSYNLEVIRDNLTDETLLVQENYDFYKILERSTDIKIVDQVDNDRIAFLRKPEKAPKGYELERIITSPMRENSDIIYVYNHSIETKEGE